MFSNLKVKLGLFFLLIIIFSISVINLQKKENSSIRFKLITSTHTDLPWEFSSVNSTLEIKIGEVTNVEYIVKNLSNKIVNIQPDKNTKRDMFEFLNLIFFLSKYEKKNK